MNKTKKHHSKEVERRETTIKLENVEASLRQDGFYQTRATTNTRHYHKGYIHIILSTIKNGKTQIDSHIDREPHKLGVESPPEGLITQILIKANTIQQKRMLARP